MKYKKFRITSTWSTIFFIITGIFLYSFLNWLKLKFPWLTQTSLLSRFSEIHFSSPGNNFWWWIFWLNTESLTTPKTITAWWITKTCTKQLRWIYYNAARWARLWPLDEKTFTMLNEQNWYQWLTLTWWLFTACWWDSYGIFGYIKYTRWWNDSHIIAGTRLDYQNNTFLANFANSFEYFNNVTPLGYIWDSIWWIWFVWWSIEWSQNLITNINNWWNINNSFTNSWNNIVSTNPNWSILASWDSQAQDTMWNILIQGNTFISTAIAPDEKRALLWNIEKRTILMISDLNPSDVINKAKKNAETLCRWKTYLVGETWITSLPENNKDAVLCYKNTNNLEIDLSQDLHRNKTIIMNNWSITLKNSMNKDWDHLDLFIDWWVLAIKNNPNQKTIFNQDWYPSNIEPKSSWIFMKWNIVINWLLVWWTPENIEPINHKTHLLGKIVFLNTPTTPSEWRKTQVNSILWTTAFEPRINLENVFGWYCNLEWQASDWTDCWWWYSSATTVPFVVLNANYPSNIIR